MSRNLPVTEQSEARIAISPGYRLQWEEAQQCHVLLYPEGMVKLNGSSAEILKYCDGSRSAAQIVAELEQRFPGVDLAADVHQFLEVADERGWIKKR
jgi:pyrroloquinoline quinone biosynthesis protein D